MDSTSFNSAIKSTKDFSLMANCGLYYTSNLLNNMVIWESHSDWFGLVCPKYSSMGKTLGQLFYEPQNNELFFVNLFL